MTAGTAQLAFRRPSGSVADTGIAVAMYPDSGGVIVGDTGDPHGPVLVFEAGQWRRLTATVRRGDWPRTYFGWNCPDHTHISVTVPGDDTALRFPVVDMKAFEQAVHNGEFDLPAPGI